MRARVNRLATQRSALYIFRTCRAVITSVGESNVTTDYRARFSLLTGHHHSSIVVLPGDQRDRAIALLFRVRAVHRNTNAFIGIAIDLIGPSVSISTESNAY